MHERTPHPSAPGAVTAGPRRTRRRIAAVGTLALSASALTLSALPAGAQSGGSVGLVAYSTPKPAYTVLATDFAKTKAGAGVTVSPSFGPSGTQATSVVDGLPADLVNFSLEPDMAKLVKAGLVSEHVGQGGHQGHGDGLHRLVRGAPRQSQAHHHLGRPREVRRRGHHAQRVQLGQREVEHHGGLRRRARAGQDARAGPAVPLPAPAQRGGAALQRQRRAADLPLGSG